MHPALAYARQIAYSSEEVLQFTYDQAVKYKDSPGVYVECGVAAGAQIIAMAAGAPNKTIYAFDSFEGIPLASNKDNQAPGLHYFTKSEQAALPNPGEQVLVSSGATVVSEFDFWMNISNAFNKELKYHESFGINIYQIEGMKIIPVVGWFEQTLEYEADTIEPISILRLDGDLYNSTYVCLKYLYPRVIKGGLVIIDDWALEGCRAAFRDYFPVDFRWHVDMNFIEGKESTVAYFIK
jgi:O-methyltransferase